MKDRARDLLKQILQGRAEAGHVFEELKRLNPITELVPVLSYADEPGIYKVGEVGGLTEEEMKEAIGNKNPFHIKIHRTGHPIAYSEREVLERIALEERNGK